MQQFIHSRNPFSWYMIHYVVVDPTNDVFVTLKQLWNNLLRNFVRVFVFQKRPSIKLCGSKFQQFSSGKILSDSNFRMGFACLACMRDHTQRAMMLSNKLSIISLCDYPNWYPKIRNFNVFFNQWIGKFLDFFFFCFGLIFLFLEEKIIKCPITLK